jgi:hypothetical protein
MRQYAVSQLAWPREPGSLNDPYPFCLAPRAVVGRSPRGRTVHKKGTDPDSLIARCKEDARAIG